MAEKKMQEYNAQGSEAMKSAKDEDPGFKKGGKTRRALKHGGKAKHSKGHADGGATEPAAEKKQHLKSGGTVAGEHAKHRMDRPKRKAGGRTPYSTGHMGGGNPSNPNSGHESQRPPEGGA